MCGIIGYAGHRPAVPVVIEGLRRLEYRGYDSAGVACVQRGELCITRAQGKLSALEEKLAKEPVSMATCAMGHTRWATHGVPAERNAHPHASNDGRLAIVHNGIIENYQELKEELLQKGYVFHSETDTEVLVNLIADCHKQEADLLKAFAAALRRAHGAYAVCLMSREYPGEIWAARMSAPLIFGIGTGEHFVASDIPAFLPYTRTVVFLEDGEIVHATNSEYEILSLADLSPVEHEPQTIQWDMQAAQKGGYRHFMLKEIFEQPQVIVDGLSGRLNAARDTVLLPELDALPVPRRLHIVACGTSYHSGLWARHLIEPWAKVPVQLEIASEFHYRESLPLDKDDMVLVISQSGETLDTLAALKLARERGAKTLAVVNVVGSSIARAADWVLYTYAGPEIAVASTKAYSVQMAVLYLFALRLALVRGAQDECIVRHLTVELQRVPELLRPILKDCDNIKYLASQFMNSDHLFFMGRGFDYALSLEGSLKLKEISYVHSEAYAAGELKHGTISLIVEGTPVVALATQDSVYEKTISNVKEVKTRGGRVILLCKQDAKVPADAADHVVRLPEFEGVFMPLLLIVPLQLFAYYMSVLRGCDVDKPRNLAKSVTVE